MRSHLLSSITLLFMVVILAQSQDYNFTYIDFPINYDKLQMCEIPSADGTYCAKCARNLTRLDYHMYDYGYCVMQFPTDYCYAFDFIYNCMLCHDGYYLKESKNDINLCIPKTLGCLTYDTGSKKCQTCLSGWTMNTTVNRWSNLTEYFCYFVADPNCASYDANKNCLSCKTNFALSANKCVYSIPNCETMSGTACAKCKAGYKLDSAGNCIVAFAQISNCLTQLDATCQACVTGYQLSNNACVFIIDNCKVVSGQICTQCNTNYAVTTDGKCALIPRISNCFTQVDYTCQSCATGYQLVSNSCVYIIDHCKVVTGTVCSQCNTDYEKTVDGKCSYIPRISNCISQVDYTCSGCAAGYQLVSNACIFIIENCKVVTGQICSQCNTNYEMTVDGKCSLIPRISNCLTQVDYTCSGCVAGYQLINNACVFIIDNCKTVSGQTCTQCNTNYQVTIDGKCSLIPRIANCDIQVDYNCQTCLSKYTLVNNQCIVVIPNCLQVTGFDCTTCATGYIPFNGQCIPKIQNCIIQSGTNCGKCLTGYDLVNMTSCVYHIDNCVKVNGMACFICADGYELKPNGQCSLIPVVIVDPALFFDPNCKTYDMVTFSKCLECGKGFFLNAKGTCEQVDPLCKTYNSVNGFCLSCYIGYTLDLINGKCSRTPASVHQLDNCNEYDFVKDVCVKCAEGCYFDANGKCQRWADANCKTPSTDLKSCSECYKGYAYDSVQMKCIIGNYNCATWSNGVCATCPQGYYLDQTSNCTLTDPFCKIFSPLTKTCFLCYPGYVFDVDRKCKEVSQISQTLQKYSLNCAKYNDKGQCLSCYFGYYILTDSVGPYCQKVNDLCKTYSVLTGKCTSCYFGYYLSTTGDCLRFY